MTRHEVVTDTAPAAAAPQPRRRFKRWLVLAIVLIAAVGLVVREPLLRATAKVLIVEEPLRPADSVLILSGDGTLNEAARLCREGLAARVLLIDGRHRRLERLGIQPTPVATARRELAALGVPEERIDVLDCRDAHGWDYLRRLGAWLDERPAAQVTALADQFGTRDIQYQLWAALPRATSERIHLRALPHRWYDESNWWRRKEGALSVFHEYLRLGYDAWHGEDSEPWRDWDPATYRQALPSTP